MGYRYGDKRTALNGVFKHVFSYPKAKEILDFYKGIPIDQRHCRWSAGGFNQFMSDYRLSKGDPPSKNPIRNAQYIQNDFEPFIKYCQLKLK